jgi:hypothetical protein
MQPEEIVLVRSKAAAAVFKCSILSLLQLAAAPGAASGVALVCRAPVAVPAEGRAVWQPHRSGLLLPLTHFRQVSLTQFCGSRPGRLPLEKYRQLS